MPDKKHPEVIDDLDLLGPIEESGISKATRKGGAESTLVGPAGGGITEERTTIIDAFALTGRRPSLVVSAGPDTGKQVVIDKEVFEIGRGTANDYVLHDLAVSRRHVKLVSRGETYSVVDMGSGNGTRVNGVRVTELVLHDGDEINIGNTTMRFEWPVESTLVGGGEKTQIFAPISQVKKIKEPAKVDMSHLMPWVIYGGGGLLIMAIIIVVVVFAIGRLGGENEKDNIGVVVERNIKAGIEDYKGGRFKDAQDKFVKALMFDPTNSIANEFKGKSDYELENEARFNEAQKMIAASQFKEASQKIKEIPTDSYFASKLDALRERITGFINTRLNDAEVAISQGKFNSAQIYLETIKAIEPDNKRAQELLNKLDSEANKGSGRKTAAVEEDRTPRENVSSRQSSRTSSSSSRSSSSAEEKGSLGKYKSLYKQGRLEDAISELQSSPEVNSPAGKALLNKMRSFGLFYKSGKNFYMKKDRVQAKTYLQKARSVDQEITRGSTYSKEIDRMLKSL